MILISYSKVKIAINQEVPVLILSGRKTSYRNF